MKEQLPFCKELSILCIEYRVVVYRVVQPYSPSTHHCHILIQPVGHCKPHDEVGSQNLIELISGIRIGNLWMLNLTHYPIALVTPFLRVYSMKYNYLIGLIPDLRFVKNKCICFVGFCQFHISS